MSKIFDKNNPDTDSVKKGENQFNPGKCIDSSVLFGSDHLIIISHGKDYYRLMITKQGKLILTK